MKTTKTIKVTSQEILEYYVSVVEDCTVAEARDILKNANIFYEIQDSGDFNMSNHNKTLKEILITYGN